MINIKKAGAIVLSYSNPSLIALLYRSKEKDWSFPKGHVEEGESVVKTTIREIMEETGLKVHLVNKLPSIKYCKPNGDYILLNMFLMQSEDDSTLKTEFEGDKIMWVSFKEVDKKLSYDNLKQYYTEVLEKIENTITALQSKNY